MERMTISFDEAVHGTKRDIKIITDYAYASLKLKENATGEEYHYNYHKSLRRV